MKVNCQAQAVKEDWVKNAGVRRNDANAEVRSENSEVKRENANAESRIFGAICLLSGLLLLNSEFWPFAYSYLSASTGSSFDARNAGINPLITPTSNSTNVETSSVMIEICR